MQHPSPCPLYPPSLSLGWRARTPAREHWPVNFIKIK
jgi:hypothetical protein